ncbi:hypothetical protein L6Q21_13920 [Sandaracinobacter sp. RS1-74]|uniref:hypothetical protein n=1 Tax=Sandaracinobacteroides sayramensis TaxID=2913411 RepID=UPI001EDA2EF6|nr:hypothetical protein [Sandaracinobacteroides sayramensis]MCG2842081.1 hypothetical protein [Sandaracinobacteroides sayramensis]
MERSSLLLFAAALVAASPAAADDFQPLSLVCAGGGTTESDEVTTATVTKDGKTTTGTVITDKLVDFSDQTRVEIASPTSGRIQMPSALMPPIRNRSDGGWLEIRNLNVTEAEISGSVSTGPMNSPKLRIDRVTGFMKIHGKTGHFSGTCNPYDPSSSRRF